VCRHHHINIGSLRGSLFLNSLFLILNTLAGSAFGFLFWGLAVRLCAPAQVGLGAAYITAVTLLSNLGDIGLGVALVRFASSMKDEQVTFINSGLAAVAGITFLLTLGFVASAPIWSSEFSTLTSSGFHIGLFTSVSLMFSAVQFLDRLYIAFQVTHFMFARNVLANLLRIGLMIALSHSLGAIGLLLAVGGGALVTLGLSAMVFAPQVIPGYWPRLDFAWSLLRDKICYSLGNHFSQLMWSAPPLIYPLVIVSLLGAEANARFYISWMISNLLFIVPTAVATSAFARYAKCADMSEKTLGWTMRLTLLGLVPIVLGLMISSSLLLSVFGGEYVTGGHSLLKLLLVSAFPYTINTFVVTDYRIRQHVRGVVVVSGLIALLSLALIIVFGVTCALPGVGVGWLSGQLIGAVFALLHRRHDMRTR
jgi:O-antigen/teichoic acid export membrane protein